LVESEKLNYVFRLATTDAWLLPIIIGKAGKNVKKIETDSGCIIDIFKDELTVVVRAESEEAVDLGKNAVETIVDQARKENVFIELPESAIPAFVGKGGAHIKQLSLEHDVEIEKTKKHQNLIRIIGKEEAVANAKDAVLSWLSEWEASHTGLTIDVDEQFIPSIVGKGGETIRSIQKETKCKIDIDKIHSTLTVREGTESARVEAMDRVKAIIEEEKATAAERAAEREKLRQEQAELARINAKTRDASSDQKPADAEEDLSGVKDRSREFSARPVGWAATKFKNNGANMDAIETGTKEGRELYLMLISGDDDQDDQWDSSTVSSSTAMISVCDFGGEHDLHYRSVSGFTVRI
jgi:predicted PilT family ATPase